MISITNKFLTLCCVVICSSTAYAACSEHEKQKMLDSGISKSRIDNICGNASGTQQSSNICQTKYMRCALNKTGPVGTPCWCVSANGPQPGFLVPKNQ